MSIETDLSPEQFMEEAGLTMTTKPEPSIRKTRGGKRELLEGEIGEVEITPETVLHETVRLMKVVSITRRPEGRIAAVELRVKDGTLYNITIDEATAKVLASIFD